METIKRVLDKEFAANGIDIRARVREYAWQHNKVTNYEVDLLYKGSQLVMTLRMYAQRPFQPKLKPFNFMEPHKMIRLCEVIREAYLELERLSEQD